MIPKFLLGEPDSTTWSVRYRQLNEVLHDGPEVRAAIVAYLEKLLKTKDLSFGERKLWDQAKNYDEYVKEQNKKVLSIQKYLNRKIL